MIKTCALVVAALAALAGPARAAFEDLGAGARAAGMGDAFVAIADDAYAIHYNPAGLALLNRPELATAYTRHLMGLTDKSELSSSFIGYAHPLAEGRRGTVAAGWQQFTLNGGLYNEQTLSGSYGRALFPALGPGALYGGLNAKYLRRSFGSVPEADNAMRGFAATGRADPVLTARNSMATMDSDLGLLYRLKQHYAIGLTVQHLFEPNVAFDRSDSDTVARAVKLGFGYRGLLSNLSAQVDMRRSPQGSQDKNFTIGAERWFPRLLVGEFGVRGGLGLGSREYKQISAGVSYRTRRLVVDYGFAIPIGTIASTAGSHRFGVSIRFGKLAEPDESVIMLLEAMRRLKIGSIPELRAFGPGLSPAQKAILNELLANAQALQTQAQYRAAADKVSQALTLSPGDAELLKSFGRLNFVAQPIQSLPKYKEDAVEAALHQGILAYLAFNDLQAVEKTARALSLRPGDRMIESFLTQLERATGLTRPAIAPVEPRRLKIEQDLAEVAAAMETGKYDDAIRLSERVLKLDPASLAAWENLGTALFAIGDYVRSLQAWEKAFGLADSQRRAAISQHIKALRKLLSRPRPRLADRVEAVPVSPQQIQTIYNQGVDYYTAGDLQNAKAAFERVVALDPAYVPAVKALRRVVEELKQK